MKVTLEDAKIRLKAGQVVAIPTETVYGLAARADSNQAVHQVFALKGRPSNNPMIVHIGNSEDCFQYITHRSGHLEAIAEAFWPGPLTMVLPVHKDRIAPIVRANLDTCAFRMPSHPLTLELLQQTMPLVAPSANLSGSPSATKPEHVEHDFGNDFPVLDGGSCLHGLESTIIAFTDGGWQIARLGAISQEELAKVLGYVPKLAELNKDKPICPGQLYKHYAPKARLFLSDTYKQHGTVVGFGSRRYEGAEKVFILSENIDAQEAASNLYDTLRALDKENISEAWVDMNIPDTGLWKTIRERLNRAALRH